MRYITKVRPTSGLCPTGPCRRGPDTCTQKTFLFFIFCFIELFFALYYVFSPTVFHHSNHVCLWFNILIIFEFSPKNRGDIRIGRPYLWPLVDPSEKLQDFDSPTERRRTERRWTERRRTERRWTERRRTERCRTERRETLLRIGSNFDKLNNGGFICS